MHLNPNLGFALNGVKVLISHNLAVLKCIPFHYQILTLVTLITKNTSNLCIFMQDHISRLICFSEVQPKTLLLILQIIFMISIRNQNYFDKKYVKFKIRAK
jgi:hypothetical protein